MVLYMNSAVDRGQGPHFADTGASMFFFSGGQGNFHIKLLVHNLIFLKLLHVNDNKFMEVN
jgi:hypothetical protein